MDAIIGTDDYCGQTVIPITVQNGANVGSVDVVIHFDPAVLNFVGVTDGDMDSMLANMEQASRGIVHIAGFQTMRPGLNGSFTLANLELTPKSGSCSFRIMVDTFKDATPIGTPMAYIISHGSYRSDCGSPVPPPLPDLCEGVVCDPKCYGTDKHQTTCEGGVCIKGLLLEPDASSCGYVPPDPSPDPTPDPTPTPKESYVSIIIVIVLAWILGILG